MSTDSGSHRVADPVAAGEVHLLRLALDTQLDTMLLVLGGAARDESARESTYDDSSLTGGRIHRWLLQDIGLVQEMAALLVNAGASIPTVLGPSSESEGPHSLVEDLAARCQATVGVLRELRERIASREQGSEVCDPIDMRALTMLINSYDQRLAELSEVE